MVEKRVVTVIPASTNHNVGLTNNKVIKKKVAAYCRVSTDSEEQASSYDAQVEFYTNYINSRNDWEFAGAFADDGISGTNTKKRVEFNRMIQSCKDGKINMIITKSISRFARNTLDCLKYIRELKEYNVPVYFEKENINTMDSKGEVLLTIMASLAQQESESISKNVRMGIQYRYQKGEVRVNHSRFLGYTKDENKNLVIDHAEAEVVKRIFKEYLEGKSLNKIAKDLMKDNILTAANKPTWRGESIRKILLNEKYMGDALLQKTCTVDVLNKKRVVNNGLAPQYYVENSHEAIISKEMFQRVQQELKRRSKLHEQQKISRTAYNSKYALSSILECEKCGNYLRRVEHNSKGKHYVRWRCKTRITEGICKCNSESISEKELQNHIIRVINRMLGNRVNMLESLKNDIEEVIVLDSGSLSGIEKRIKDLQRELESCINQNTNYEHIILEIDELLSIKNNTQIQNNEQENFQNRLSEINDFIESQSTLIDEFDEDIVRKIITKVVVGDKSIEVVFKSGQSMKVKRLID